MDEKRILQLRVMLALEIVGLTQKDFAGRHKIDQPYVCKILGRPTLRPDIWSLLVRDLGFDPRKEISPALRQVLMKLINP